MDQPLEWNDRRLVLHADDFGQSDAINTGILRGFSHGLLTSTSVLANGAACAAALTAWKELQADRRHLASAPARRMLDEIDLPFDLGVHLNLTQGRPLTANYPAELLDAQGRFPGIVALAWRLWRQPKRYRHNVADELHAQTALLFDRGVAPTHLNGHQYVELLPALAETIGQLGRRFGIGVVRVALEPRIWPLGLRSVGKAGLARIKRHFAERFLVRASANGWPHPAAFFGTVHAGRINLDLLCRFVASAPTGLTEIGLHPGAQSLVVPVDADGWNDPLAAFRFAELAMLTSPELVHILATAGIRLGRLTNLAKPLDEAAQFIAA